MAKPGTLYEMSWGRLRLFGSSIDTDASRTQVVHDLASGDVHPTQDRGRRIRKARVSLQFDDFPGQPPPQEALRLLIDAKDSGASAIFRHPIEGNFQASIGEFTYVIDEHSNITAMAEFLADEEVLGAVPVGAATSPTAGAGSVSAAADVLDQELAAVKARPLNDEEVLQFISDPSDVKKPPLTDEQVLEFISDPSDAFVTDDARAATQSWSDQIDVPTRQILIDSSRISTRTALLIEEQGLERDLALFPAFRAAIMFGDSVRAASQAATADTSSVFVMRVVQATSLRALAARVYGGAEADDRIRQIMALNDIRTPGWLTPGDYIMPARSRSQRLFL